MILQYVLWAASPTQYHLEKHMRLIKTLALAAALIGPATFSSALELQGLPILSDGTNAQTLQNDQGIHKVNACGYTFHIRTHDALNNYNRMKPRLEAKGGYVYYHTNISGKRYCVCGWGMYEHLTGKEF